MLNKSIIVIKEESKVHKVIFILDDELNTADIIMDSSIKEVKIHFPSQSISKKEINSTLKMTNHSRRTTLFVIHCLVKRSIDGA